MVNRVSPVVTSLPSAETSIAGVVDMSGMLRGRWSLRWLLAIGALALASVSAPAAASRAILVFGDSLSSGYGLPREQAWVSLLAEKLKAERFDYTVANASISGETTAGGRRRIAAALAQHKPAIVLIALGGNDGLRGHAVEAIRENLEAIVDASQKSKSQVVLIGMRLPPNYGNAYAGKFHAVFTEVAKKHKLALTPFLLEGFGDKPEWFQADGIHPAARAQPVMLDTVWKTLAPLLKQPS
jgi:acyl-CoA thioesterase I